MQILYLGGTGRTGSTLIDKALGQLQGFFAAGELTWFWYALAGGGRCSCGEPLAECTVWRAVLTEAFGGVTAVDPAEMMALRRRFDSRYLPLMATERIRQRLLQRCAPLPERLERFYRAIGDVTACETIIDSSKEPHYSFILSSIPGIDLRVMHIVRDPRAIAYSWGRVRVEHGFDDGSEMERRSPAKSAVYHDVSNVAGEFLWSRVATDVRRLRYEDFVQSPASVATATSALLGRPVDVGGVIEGAYLDAHPTHSAWGNPNRFDTGTIEIRPDEEWRKQMSAAAKTTSTVMTLPLLHRYGYRLRS